MPFKYNKLTWKNFSDGNKEDSLTLNQLHVGFSSSGGKKNIKSKKKKSISTHSSSIHLHSTMNCNGLYKSPSKTNTSEKQSHFIWLKYLSTLQVPHQVAHCNAVCFSSPHTWPTWHYKTAAPIVNFHISFVIAVTRQAVFTWPHFAGSGCNSIGGGQTIFNWTQKRWLWFGSASLLLGHLWLDFYAHNFCNHLPHFRFLYE